MTTTLTARHIDVMRHSRHVTVTEQDGAAVLSCRTNSSIVLGLLARPLPRPVSNFVLRRYAVPIVAADTDLGASPSRGGTGLTAVISNARRNPNWAAFVDTVRAGHQLEVQWERDGYALLQVRSGDDIEDQFAFRATRGTRRTLKHAQPRVRNIATRAFATMTNIAGRVPVPRRHNGATASSQPTSSVNGDAKAAAPVPAAVNDER